MKFFSLVFSALFDPNEFFYQRNRKKFHEAIARGEHPEIPIQFGRNCAFRVDPRDIVVTQEFRNQCEAIRHIRAP